MNKKVEKVDKLRKKVKIKPRKSERKIWNFKSLKNFSNIYWNEKSNVKLWL